eukprot:3614169-Pyramimonas_sp.AAC.1
MPILAASGNWSGVDGAGTDRPVLMEQKPDALNQDSLSQDCSEHTPRRPRQALINPRWWPPLS